MAAQRNYLQSLGAELAEQGVAVTRVYISSIIENSAIYRKAVDSGQKIPDFLTVNPDELADRLWSMQQRGGSREAIVPKWGRLFGSVMSTKRRESVVVELALLLACVASSIVSGFAIF